MNRREFFAASASIPLAEAVAKIPLSKLELQILAMCATPREAWLGREDDYFKERIVRPGDEMYQTCKQLAARGLVVLDDISPSYMNMEWSAVTTEAGKAALREAGVDV